MGVGAWGGGVGQGLGWVGMGWGHRWLTPALGIQYILTKGGGGGGEAAVRGWGSAHVAQERLVDVDEKMVTQRDDGFSAGGGITKKKERKLLCVSLAAAMR